MSSLRGRIAAILLLASCAQAHAAVGPETVEPFAEFAVELRINDQSETTTLCVRRDADGTLLVRADDLATLRLRTPDRGTVLVNGERYYRLGAEIGAQVTFDEATQTAQVTVPAQTFLPTTTARREANRPAITRPDVGGFVNYDVSAESTNSLRQGGGFFEFGLFGARGVATGTMVALADSNGGHSVARLDTTWTRDLPDRLATLRVGDAVSTPGGWGRSVRFGGLQFGTNFGTQPTLVTTPLVAAQGEAVVPSTVDVFVNGQSVASERVPPGPFSIDRLPLVTGAGQLQVVVTDALGRQQVLTRPYYSGAAMLRAGLADYSFELGGVREDYGFASFAYGDLLGVASYRRGLTDRLTAGVRAEAQGDRIFALGGDAAWQVAELGIVSGHVAGSSGNDGPGYAAGLGVEHDGRFLSAYAQTQFTSRRFAQVGMSEPERPPRQRTFAGVGFTLGARGNLQFVYGLQSYHDATSVKTLGVTYSLSLGGLGHLSLVVTQTSADARETNLLATWTMPLGDRRTWSTGVERSSAPESAGGGFEAYTTLQRDLPVGSGVGYRMSLSSADEGDVSLSYQGKAGTATADYAQRNGASGVRIGATGGLALTPAGVMATRRLDRSFAVVQVADYAGLTVYLDNQPVGTTDEHGRVLVDSLRPYERNEIAVDPTQVPMDGSLAQASIDVTPVYRSGALVRFPIERAHAATVRLVQRDGTPVPAGAQATLGTDAHYPVVLDGLLYVEGLAERAGVRVEWQGGACGFELHRPDGTEPVPDLGTIRCE
jgi:outer membrane usher protein